MSKIKSKLRFADLPTDYTALCGILTPRPIRDATDYANTCEVTDAMALHVDDFTGDQDDYFSVLCTLIVAYDAEHASVKKMKPLKALQYVIEQSQMSAADLGRLLGTTRQQAAAILRGDREITASHARALGKHFHLEPGLFIG